MKNTATIGMRIALDPSVVGFAALNALLEGLEKTGKRGDWGFAGWPLLDLSPKTQGTVIFEGKRYFSYKVNVSLVNEKNKVLAKNTITLNTSELKYSSVDTKVQPPDGIFKTLHFPNVKAEDLTPTLTIIIESVNGIPSRDLNASGYMKIDTADLEKRESEAERQVAAMKALTEREAAVKKAQKELEAAQKKAAGKAFWKEAQRDSMALAVFYQFANDDAIGSGIGAELGFYSSPVRFTNMGLEIKGGLFDQNFSDPNKENEGYYINASPVLGLVLPLTGGFRLFTDGILELGLFGTDLKGTITDYLTYGFDFGVLWSGIALKYRGVFYDRSFVNSIGIGLSF
jgi:hypothetical protein